jgi:hypothetical protein
MALPFGIHTGISEDVYHADPAEVPSLSSHVAGTLVGQTPLHAWQEHPKLGGGGEWSESASQSRGTLMHTLLLRSGKDIVIVEADDWRTKAAKEERSAAQDAGKQAVLRPKYDDAIAAVNAIRRKLVDQGIDLAAGHNEVTMLWGRDGVTCRGRLDHWREDLLTVVDLKICESANPEAFARSAVSYGYHIQAAAYLDGIAKLVPNAAGRTKYLWAICEPNPPYAVVIAEPDGPMMELGARLWERAISEWRVCLTLNRWPGYGDGVHRIELPPWALAKDMEQQMKQLEGGSANVGF